MLKIKTLIIVSIFSTFLVQCVSIRNKKISTLTEIVQLKIKDSGTTNVKYIDDNRLFIKNKQYLKSSINKVGEVFNDFGKERKLDKFSMFHKQLIFYQDNSDTCLFINMVQYFDEEIFYTKLDLRFGGGCSNIILLYNLSSDTLIRCECAGLS